LGLHTPKSNLPVVESDLICRKDKC
jgi:hypothetical protein